ncbi:serine hydrolase [Amycolatopsis magusensis]|uniref:serine hydrolase n=1 Tax=Amycolatopsis magusensis TaxID=882444 RepID=UPI0024A99C44|nr:serine hydrolase [Amycolatopsis magusensis]MDI5976197.1 serine hydrolase [Amycolatopsis magusensis]
MLNRRKLLLSVAAAGSAALLPPPRAQAQPSPAAEWLDWMAANRAKVGAMVDDGAGRVLAHRAKEPMVLASTVKIVHLTAYAQAVAEGRLDPAEQIRVGDWDIRHPYVSDGGAHRAALTALGIPCDEFGIAHDPERLVTLDQIAAAMILFSDNAAPDYLRHRLGQRALVKAANWSRPDFRSMQGEVLQLIMPELCGPTPAARRAIGDALAAKFIHSAEFRRHTMNRIPAMPSTSVRQWPWTSGHMRGTAADLAGLHRAVAATGGLARDHLERPLASLVPEGATAVGFKGGSFPRTLTMGMSVRWKDGRIGSLALLLTGISDEQQAGFEGFLTAGLDALSTPSGFDGLARALGA